MPRFEQDIRALVDLQTVIDTIPALVVGALPDGSIEFVNEGWREYTGLSTEELKGWDWQTAIHPDDRSKFIDEWGAARGAGRPFQNEARVRRADGHYQWFLIRKTPLRNQAGQVVRWYVTGYDIEDRKQAEDRVRLIIDTIPMMAWSVRPDGIVDFLNQRWLDYTGLSLEKYVEDPMGPIHPDDIAKIMEQWKADMVAGKPYEAEMRLRRADGTYRWFLVRTAPLRDKLGNIVKWYGSSTDIDDHKLAEEELRRLSGQLLRSQDEEQRRLARELHDSTAQSLAGLRLSLAVLEESVVEQHDAALDPRTTNALADAVAVTDRCLSEIRTISYLLHPPMLDELGLRSALVSYVKGFIQRSGIQVDLDVAPDFGRLPQDVETTLFRIVQEALTNIHRHSRSSTARIRIRHQANEVTMSVSDSGRGVGEALKEQNSPGVGIASMRERVQLLGGRVEIRSDQDGTTVGIFIPLGIKQHV